jgi:hypothetical protein
LQQPFGFIDSLELLVKRRKNRLLSPSWLEKEWMFSILYKLKYGVVWNEQSTEATALAQA